MPSILIVRETIIEESALIYRVTVALVLCLLTAFAWSQEEGDNVDPAVLDRPIYIPLKPAFVVNYGGQGKLKYLKVEISLRVKDTVAGNAVRHHMPLIRHHLVMLLSKQRDEDIDTQAGKEFLRQTALAGIQELIQEENGEQGVMDLFFNNFVIQR